MSKAFVVFLFLVALIPISLGLDIYFASSVIKLFNISFPGDCTEDDPCNNGIGASQTIELPSGANLILLNYIPALLAGFSVTEPYGYLSVQFRTGLLPPLAKFTAFNLTISDVSLLAGSVSLTLDSTHLTLDNWTTSVAGIASYAPMSNLESFTIKNSTIYNLPIPASAPTLAEVRLEHVEATSLSIPAVSSTISMLHTLANNVISMQAPNISIQYSTLAEVTTLAITGDHIEVIGSSFLGTLSTSTLHTPTSLISFVAKDSTFELLFGYGSYHLSAQSIDLQACTWPEGYSLQITGEEVSLTDCKFETTVSTGSPITNITATLIYFQNNAWSDSMGLQSTVHLQSPSLLQNLTISGNFSIPTLSLAQADWLILDGQITVPMELSLESVGQAWVTGVLELQNSITVHAAETLIKVRPEGVLRIISSDPGIYISAYWTLEVEGLLDFVVVPGVEVMTGSSWAVASSGSFTLPPPLSALGRLGYEGIFWSASSPLDLWMFNVTATYCGPIGCGFGFCRGRNDVCACIVDFDGPYCDCTLLGIPSTGFCDPLGGLRWIVNSTLAILEDELVALPFGYALHVDGDLLLEGTLNLAESTAVNVVGSFEHHGTISIATTALENEPYAANRRDSLSGCTYNLTSFITTSNYSSNGSSTTNITIDATQLSTSQQCAAESAILDSYSSHLDGFYRIQVLGNENTNMRADVSRSSNRSTSGNAGTLRIETETSACSTVSQSPGIITIFVQPCDPTNRNKKSNIKWYYWAAPVIAVVALTIITGAIILSHPPLRTKFLPFRGTHL